MCMCMCIYASMYARIYICIHVCLLYSGFPELLVPLCVCGAHEDVRYTVARQGLEFRFLHFFLFLTTSIPITITLTITITTNIFVVIFFSMFIGYSIL
jgi:hypothetical protein